MKLTWLLVRLSSIKTLQVGWAVGTKGTAALHMMTRSIGVVVSVVVGGWAAPHQHIGRGNMRTEREREVDSNQAERPPV